MPVADAKPANPVVSEDVSRVKSVFHSVDTNGDGYLSFDEMCDLLQRCAGGELGLSDVDLRKLYDMVDKNKNGKVEFDELVDFLCSEAQGHLEVQAASIRCQITENMESAGKPCLVVCILGSTKFNCPDTEELVKATAKELGALKQDIVYVTGGNIGVQHVWTETCASQKLWHVLPAGGQSGFKFGTDVHAGSTPQERQTVFGNIGDVYICFEGGPGVAKEARIAAERGAAVVPLVRTGGASGGMFDFPPTAMTCPANVAKEQFALLSNDKASIADSAKAAAAITLELGTQVCAARAKAAPGH